MPYSQTREDQPSREAFEAGAKRVIAKAGTVWFFNARIWHAGGSNHTDQWRHAMTINMCRPYMKQRIDIPRAMAGMDLSGVSQTALQKLGFLAQVPA
ncbi:MAG: phytanoyl-CoA dioxygenase family protein, partial [Methylophilaceae bacterium]